MATTPAAAKAITITLSKTKSTKGTTVFESEDKTAAVSPLYVRKPVFEKAKTIKVTVEEVA